VQINPNQDINIFVIFVLFVLYWFYFEDKKHIMIASSKGKPMLTMPTRAQLNGVNFMSNVHAVITELKANGQDFEWYPTTQEMINVVSEDLSTILKTHDFHDAYNHDIRLLDVGAGDGRVLTSLKQSLSVVISERQSIGLFAIEKASVHTNLYRNKDIVLLGTEFNETNFISKNADVCFVNPPYEHFSSWLSTLISKLNFGLLYAIVPSRWRDDKAIKQAIESRLIKDVSILAEMDFLNADRVARAKVDIIRFSFNDFEAEIAKVEKNSNRRKFHYTPIIGQSSVDSFQQFIENELGLKKTYSNTTNKFSEQCERERVSKALQDESSPSHALVVSRGVLAALLENYEMDLSHVLCEYKKISTLDPELLQELGVRYEDLREGVKAKLFGYRNVYWSLLFDHLEVLTERLKSNHKTRLLNTLKSNALDFTRTNAIYIVNYAVSMANELISESIIDVYKNLTCEASISRYYKSNGHMFKDNWRHNLASEEAANKAKYLLDYRFIVSSWENFSTHSWESGLSESSQQFINDLKVVFLLLGYSNMTINKPYSEFAKGNTLIVTGLDAYGVTVELLHVKFYLNGNRHCKFLPDAMLRFNVAASRLLGWVRDRQDFEQDSNSVVSRDVWAVADGMQIQPTFVLSLTDKRAA
jgi:hypothetical protein